MRKKPKLTLQSLLIHHQTRLWQAALWAFSSDSQALRLVPPHTGSPGPFGSGTPEESEKSPERVLRARAPKVLDSFRTLLRLWGALFRDFWGPGPGGSLRTLFGLFRAFQARRAWDTLCGAEPIATQAPREGPVLGKN